MQGGPRVEIIVPVFGMITGLVVIGMVFVGPVGKAVGEAIRYWLAGGRHRQPALAPADLDEVHERLDALQRQLGELAERQGFTERLLSQARQEPRLPGAEGGAG